MIEILRAPQIVTGVDGRQEWFSPGSLPAGLESSRVVRCPSAVAGVVESHLPHGLAMLRPGVRATGVHEVPNLNSSIAGSSSQEVSSRVESASTNQILMALAAHDEVTIGNGPEFPGGVVTCSELAGQSK